MNELAQKHFIEEVITEIKRQIFVEVEASGRHVHLSKKDVEQLFGTGYKLTRAKDLSQPGQFACKERVSITGPKGTLENVVILGPERGETQIEISKTDSLILGIPAPVRQSGDVKGTPGALIENGSRKVDLPYGVIIAQRHIHMTPEDALKFQLTDGNIVKIKVFGERPVIFEDVVVRVNEKYHTNVHIDYDEANACGYHKSACGLIYGGRFYTA